MVQSSHCCCFFIWCACFVSLQLIKFTQVEADISASLIKSSLNQLLWKHTWQNKKNIFIYEPIVEILGPSSCSYLNKLMLCVNYIFHYLFCSGFFKFQIEFYLLLFIMLLLRIIKIILIFFIDCIDYRNVCF